MIQHNDDYSQRDPNWKDHTCEHRSGEDDIEVDETDLEFEERSLEAQLEDRLNKMEKQARAQEEILHAMLEGLMSRYNTRTKVREPEEDWSHHVSEVHAEDDRSDDEQVPDDGKVSEGEASEAATVIRNRPAAVSRIDTRPNAKNEVSYRGTPPPFDITQDRDRWSAWRKKLDSFLVSSGIADTSESARERAMRVALNTAFLFNTMDWI